jgi:ribosomal protein S18 acetylase RimI-like enzyme
MNTRIRPIQPADAQEIQVLLRRVSVFEPHEVAVAEELVAESLNGSSDYVINVAEEADADGADGNAGRNRIVGYVCHGHNPVTDALYDVYWIAVDPAMQGRGMGRALLACAEQSVREARGRGLVIDTSSRDIYQPARRLYESCGYRRVAEIPDFYRPGDGLVMYMKLL